MSGFLNLLQDISSHGRAMVMAVAMAVLVFSPVAEAAACGGEVELAASQIDHQIFENGSESPEKTPDGDDGDCVHGHCHHNIQPWNNNQQLGAVWINIVANSFAWADDQGPSSILEQLKPPPRA